MNLNWQWFEFLDLTSTNLYDLLRLRQDVFVIEQDCLYPELDGKDKLCSHLVGFSDGKIVATTRLLPPGVAYEQVSFGRVVIHPDWRGCGLGKVMLVEVLKGITRWYGGVAIRISAQAHLKDFYRDAGFKVLGQSYLEDGIPHFAMIRPA